MVYELKIKCSRSVIGDDIYHVSIFGAKIGGGIVNWLFSFVTFVFFCVSCIENLLKYGILYVKRPQCPVEDIAVFCNY